MSIRSLQPHRASMSPSSSLYTIPDLDKPVVSLCVQTLQFVNKKIKVLKNFTPFKNMSINKYAY